MFERERAVAEEAAQAAGAIIRAAYEQPQTVREKGRDNPVTDTDLRANECIRARLGTAFPADGWLSEETCDSAERLTRPRVWIVDPLDGTKEFINHIPELCVCIALVVDGAPVVGVSFNPIAGELFSAAAGQGLTLNGHAARASDVRDLKAARVLASRSEIKRGEWTAFEPHVRVVPTGSVAYKFARVAAGLGDATFTRTPKNEWDICAGAVLVTEGGGRITDLAGRPLRFNKPETKFSGLIATNAALYEPIRALIASVGPAVVRP
jgi:myo-inositol-1(or 4)-monophosphatase